MIELIAGYFNRHSLEYYKWKVNQFSDKTKVTLTAEDYDNLAVAYEKLGRHDKAIETINSKIEQFPDEGRYRSEANLGTFLIHDGQYEAGLQHIERAIEINPNAHFGREVYQQLLVEYVIERRAAGATLPLNVESTEKNGGFARFVLKQRNLAPEKNPITAGNCIL